MAEAFNSIKPGEVIDGKYTIGRVIGSGGMGTVYEAVHVDLKRRVALKILHSKYAKSSKIVQRFHQEARLAGSIEHDNICRVTDHGTSADGAPYLVMPLLSGQSLAGILEGKGALPQMRTIDIVCQTLQALAAAHAEKIVHRDLKPDNIFVTRVGDREDFVKLLDFGISKVLEKDSVSALTSTGMVLGTAFYLAPEQARGSKRIDHRVDIYAMGVILYEALTGVRPFDGDTYNEVVFKIAGEPVKNPRDLNPKINPAVEKVILKAMAIDPNLRFSSALEMCAALENAAVAGTYEGGALADTLGDTEVDGRPTLSTVSLRPPRRGVKLFLVIGGVLVAAAMSFFLVLQRQSDDVADGETAGKQAIEASVDSEREADSVSGAELVPPPELKNADTDDRGSSTANEPASEGAAMLDTATRQTDTASVENAVSEPKTKRRHRKNDGVRGKNKDKNFIPGRFNTKFIFEDE